MSRFLDTNPKPGDSNNTLLAKILQAFNGTPTSEDTANSLLVRILEQISGASAAVVAGGGGLTTAQAEDIFVNETGDIMSGGLRVERGVRTTGEPALEVREYWSNVAQQFSAVNIAVTNIASHTNSSFVRGEVDGIETLLLRRNGTIRTTRQLADNFENSVMQFKRGNAGDATGAIANSAGVGSNDFQGWDGAAFALVARMVAVADEAFTGAANGTHLRLYATPVGSAAAAERFRVGGSLVSSPVSIQVHSATAIPAGGTAGAGLRVSSATNFGVFFGSGAPTLSAAQGSLYLRSDGSSAVTRGYINTDGGTTWTAITTVL